MLNASRRDVEFCRVVPKLYQIVVPVLKVEANALRFLTDRFQIEKQLPHADVDYSVPLWIRQREYCGCHWHADTMQRCQCLKSYSLASVRECERRQSPNLGTGVPFAQTNCSRTLPPANREKLGSCQIAALPSSHKFTHECQRFFRFVINEFVGQKGSQVLVKHFQFGGPRDCRVPPKRIA